MNKNSTVKKVIDFRRGPDVYYERAHKFLDDGDYFSALDSLRLAINADPAEPEYRLILGEIFCEMELFDHACNEFFRLLAEGKCELECCYHLTQIFMEDENPEAAAYYLKRTYAARKDVEKLVKDTQTEDEEDVEQLYDLLDTLEENAKELERPRFSVAYDKRENCRNMVGAAVSLMRRGEFDPALKILNSVPETADCYSDALNNIALCEYSRKKYKKAWEIVQKAAGVDEENIFTMCNALLTACKLKDKEAVNAALSRLDSVNYDNISENELYRIAMTMCEMSEHARAGRCFELLLEGVFDTEIMIMAAIAFYNCGQADKARRIILDALRIDPGDAVAQWYAGRFQKPKTSRALDYTTQIQHSEGRKRMMYLSALCKLPREAFLAATEQLPANAKTIECIRWAMAGENTACILKLFTMLSGTPFGEEFAETLFLDRRVMALLKKYILQEYLARRRSGRVNIVVNDIFKTVRFTLPASTPGLSAVFRAAYIDAFTTLTLMSEGFEARLLSVFKNFLKAAAPLNGKLTNERALAAALSYQYGELKIFRDKAVLCGIYNVKMTTLRTYLKLLGISK